MGIQTDLINISNGVQQTSGSSQKTAAQTQEEQQLFSQLLTEKLGQTAQLKSTGRTISVVKGDTVSELAEKYGSSVSAIAQNNQLQDPNLILIGQQLVIPANVSGQTTSNNSVPSVSSISDATAAYTTVAADNSKETAEKEARAYIVQHESGGDYNARNGKYIGKYQLDQSYLSGDFSPANQEKVANDYVSKRYGSWVSAMAHWKVNSWY
ncbi:LysM peptidoglycan-binding domain-containing protein [Liquorilactobacillus oeni]|uniref:LysM domain protein n=1 Tax=Liquorilactobacillus oeni DSM 19972 TaxID=1423777 RepID=A0A0R1M991_9LACO|nr:LysM peptidoglycan-binding domain-containing protein [Liquorilactobacillus oeni]KRL04473.1 LysM domain protein [Liquorilactobacillus oeni DSM 19972]